MLLTRKSEDRAQAVNPIARACSALAAKTVDRRTFLKGSGITVGAAAFASQLPLNFIGEASAQAANEANASIAQRLRRKRLRPAQRDEAAPCLISQIGEIRAIMPAAAFLAHQSADHHEPRGLRHVRQG